MSEVENFYAVNGIDAGIPYDVYPPSTANRIHPADKYGISKNAAEIAITNVYGKSGYNSVAEYPVSINAESGNLVVYYKNGVELKLSTGTTVNNLEGFVDGDWEVIENATVNGNKITVSGGAKYSKIRYANYNVMMQGANNVPQIWHDEMKAYVASRLFWDMSLNVEDLVREYVTIYYGLGAENVLELINDMNKYIVEKIVK
jgi:hypothetical protein